MVGRIQHAVGRNGQDNGWATRRTRGGPKDEVRSPKDEKGGAPKHEVGGSAPDEQKLVEGRGPGQSSGNASL